MGKKITKKISLHGVVIALHVTSFTALVGWQLFISFATPYLVLI
jgi:hypothetical protein